MFKCKIKVTKLGVIFAEAAITNIGDNYDVWYGVAAFRRDFSR